MVAAVTAALSLQLQASAQASSASTSGRPWAPLRPVAVRQQLAAASGRRQRAAGGRMSAAVQAVAAEPAVAANGATGACQLDVWRVVEGLIIALWNVECAWAGQCH